MYCCLQDLVLRGAKKEDFSKELEFAIKIYGSDIHAPDLELQLQLLGDNMNEKATSIQDVKNFLLQLSSAHSSFSRKY